MIGYRTRVDDERVRAQLSQARKEAGRRVKAGLQAGADGAVLPKVLRHAPSVVRPYLTVKATLRGIYITTKGKKVGDKITGLLNFGGTVRSDITPRKRKALVIGPGIIRAAVTDDRTYAGKFFLERSRDEALPGVEDDLLRHVMPAFGELQA